MNSVFKKMNEEYISKHYPKRSFFAAYTRRITKNQLYGLIFCLVSIAAFAYLSYVIYGDMNNPDGTLTIQGGKILIGILIGFSILMALLAVLQIKRVLRGCEATMKRCAKNSGYTMNDMREFERQAMQSGTYILDFSNGELLEKARNVLFDQSDGLLTRDYLCIDPGAFMKIIKLTDIIGVYLVNEKQKVNIDTGAPLTQSVAISHLSLHVVSNKERQVFADCTKESAYAFFDLLEEHLPDLTCNRNVISEAEYHKIRDELLAQL